ncbi:uncharacterized protein LOC106162092 isoform X2 [Lingula anatina]|uniref:Uncharacterized protein LOC106162092 isoform X2 n=1 Tax=Lingula anatina TaxID=7574 RepID=A0A1S3I8U1_LINAN|nr:uncharacterized protein LOC106162092 isoform X2 [Lingula anatina]|eukprot:XP_013394680.1 uncharacterized protein LOC106162092 isoform X2 [Lingula anatina]
MDNRRNTLTEDSFIIVLFPEEGSVALIRKSWIESTENDGDEIRGICWWPSGKRSHTTALKRAYVPDKFMWTRHHIRILGYADTYEEALEKLKISEDTSNIDSPAKGNSKERNDDDNFPDEDVEYEDAGEDEVEAKEDGEVPVPKELFFSSPLPSQSKSSKPSQDDNSPAEKFCSDSGKLSC